MTRRASTGGTDYFASDTLHGALIVQPRVVLQGVEPVSGPPEGGNTVSLFGVGFSRNLVVTFNGATAGDVRLRSSSQIDVRAPSGSFGPADVDRGQAGREDDAGVEEVVVVLLIARALPVDRDVEAGDAAEPALVAGFEHVLPLGLNRLHGAAQRLLHGRRRKRRRLG